MKSISEAKVVILNWLQEMWRSHGKASRVSAEYRLLLKTAPLAMADLALYCCVHDSVFVQGDRDLTIYNAGRRDAFLHIQHAAGLSPVDLKLLKDRTEGDPE